MAGRLLVGGENQTLVLTISDPESRNAIGPDIYAAGVEALNAAEANRDVRAVIITGEGRQFCAGGNLNRLLNNRQHDPQVQADSINGFNTWIESIRHFPKPVIAAVEGAAAGAGASVALACDVLVAAEDAFLVMAYANVGLSPDGGGAWSLARHLPRATQMQMLMLGERMNAKRLYELGVVSHLSAPGEALSAALKIAASLTARAPNVMASIKDLCNEAVDVNLHQHLENEREHFVRNLHHSNGGEGIQAFLDKRQPQYR
ncbi:MAG: 1,2-epoxyphenylacetyl-CoA isomerase [Pseudomonadota bacterium]|jgi:enoyl-CoA hydratase/carnithine racemase